ncbi:hypothetical protein Btru_077407 [Bulinus truncatus]|nr:hypothetical protein Btru_077407 [Bulinus truncatus]
MCLSLLRAAVVWANLARISGFDPSSDIMTSRYLKEETTSSFCPFIRMSFSKALFVMTLVFSALIRLCCFIWFCSIAYIQIKCSINETIINNLHKLFIALYQYIELNINMVKSITFSKTAMLCRPIISNDLIYRTISHVYISNGMFTTCIQTIIRFTANDKQRVKGFFCTNILT